jgi:hypothetical protein
MLPAAGAIRRTSDPLLPVTVPPPCGVISTLVGSLAAISANTSASWVATIALAPSSFSVLSVTLATLSGAHDGGL